MLIVSFSLFYLLIHSFIQFVSLIHSSLPLNVLWRFKVRASQDGIWKSLYFTSPLQGPQQPIIEASPFLLFNIILAHDSSGYFQMIKGASVISSHKRCQINNISDSSYEYIFQLHSKGTPSQLWPAGSQSWKGAEVVTFPPSPPRFALCLADSDFRTLQISGCKEDERGTLACSGPVKSCHFPCWADVLGLHGDQHTPSHHCSAWRLWEPGSMFLHRLSFTFSSSSFSFSFLL